MRGMYFSSASVSIEATPPYNNDAPDPEPEPEVPWVQFTIPNATCEDRVEEIYEDLCYVKFTSATPEVDSVRVFGIGNSAVLCLLFYYSGKFYL